MKNSQALLRFAGKAAKKFTMITLFSTSLIAVSVGVRGGWNSISTTNFQNMFVSPFAAVAQGKKQVSVKTFGATGNGVTDDTAAIQKAFNYGAANNVNIYFPAGTYLFSSTLLMSNTAAIGAGSSSILMQNFSGEGLSLQGTNTGFSTIVLSSSLAAFSAFAPMVEVDSVSTVAVEQCTFNVPKKSTGFYVPQLSSGAASTVTVDSTAFVGPGNGTNSTAILFAGATSNAKITNNSAKGFGTGFEIGANTQGGMGYQSGFLCQGNTLSHCTNAIYLATASGSVLSNSISNCTGGGAITAGWSSLSIQNNTITNTDYYGISDTIANGTTSVSGNKLTNVNATQAADRDVIDVVPYPVQAVLNCTIENNSYAGPANSLEWFINCQVPANYVTASGNTNTVGLPSFYAQSISVVNPPPPPPPPAAAGGN